MNSGKGFEQMRLIGRTAIRLISTLILTAFAAFAGDGGPVGTVSGQVLDLNGAFVPNMNVSLHGTKGTVAEQTSRERGHFSLKAPPGTYLVKACNNSTKCIPLRYVKVSAGDETPALVRPAWVDHSFPELPLIRLLSCTASAGTRKPTRILLRAHFIRQISDVILFSGPDAAVSTEALTAYAESGRLDLRSCRVSLYGTTTIDRGTETSVQPGELLDLSSARHPGRTLNNRGPLPFSSQSARLIDKKCLDDSCVFLTLLQGQVCFERTAAFGCNVRVGKHDLNATGLVPADEAPLHHLKTSSGWTVVASSFLPAEFDIEAPGLRIRAVDALGNTRVLDENHVFLYEFRFVEALGPEHGVLIHSSIGSHAYDVRTKVWLLPPKGPPQLLSDLMGLLQSVQTATANGRQACGSNSRPTMASMPPPKVAGSTS